MKGGEVVSIRVNPQDCMAVVDVVRILGVNPQGMSFSAAVAVTLSSLLSMARDHKLIPTRDGFEYLEMMQPFSVKKRSGRKLAISSVLLDRGPDMRIAPLRPAVVDSVETTKRRRRLEELRIRLSGDDLNFTEAEHDELRELTNEFDGLPT